MGTINILFNYHDHYVQLRLLALLATFGAILCLGALEFSPHLRTQPKFMLGIAVFINCAVIVSVLATLNGA